MRARSLLRQWLRKHGLDVIRYNARSSPVARRQKLLAHYGVDLVLDVGAGTGGYALGLREMGYRGRIVSFEPLAAAFAVLERRAAADLGWEAVRAALGAQAGRQMLHVAGNSQSSSMLEMLPRHARAYPQSAYVGVEEVPVYPLDAIFHRYYRRSDVAYLKIDTQGYERHVLEGARDALADIVGVQLEMSLVPLYAGELPLSGMVAYMEALGYVLMSVEPVIDDPRTGQLLQADGVFFRGDAD
jgi:FkbM family methyltransferase